MVGDVKLGQTIRIVANLIGKCVMHHQVQVLAHGALGSILRGGLIELDLEPASAPRLVQQRLWYVLSSLWDGPYKRTLAGNRKE